MDEMRKPGKQVNVGMAATAELTQTELDKVAGGGTVSPQPIVIGDIKGESTDSGHKDWIE